jgi:pseudouridine-5'-phosphate glycosidase
LKSLAGLTALSVSQPVAAAEVVDTDRMPLLFVLRSEFPLTNDQVERIQKQWASMWQDGVKPGPLMVLPYSMTLEYLPASQGEPPVAN